jgi:glycosyltransferase involved in cell wall biosynthesis
MKPLISVIMPVFNSEKYIFEAINSILNQTLTDFEFIIINDASKDGTQVLLNSMIDKRIIQIENKIQKGNYKCRNIGMAAAKGCFIAIMDSDDIAMPNRLAIQYEFMLKRPDCVALGSNIEMMKNNHFFLLKRVESSDEIKIGLLKDNMCTHPSLMLRTEVLKKYQIIYNESYLYASDYDLMVQLSRIGKIYNLSEVLLQYRIHPNQITNQFNKQQTDFANQIRLKQLTQILHINPKKREIKMHLSLMRDSIVRVKEMKRMEKWCMKIINKNKKYKVYNNEKLQSFLLELYCSSRQL